MTEKPIRTASNLIDCLMGDIQVIIDLSDEDARDIENRFHATLRMHRRIIERASKKRKKQILAEARING